MKAAGSKRSLQTPNPKINDAKKRTPTIDTMLVPRINFKGHVPRNQSERFALGQALKLINIGANKATSSITTLENYQSSVACVAEWHNIAMKETKSRMKPPPEVKLNNHNINDGYKALLQVLPAPNLFLLITVTVISTRGFVY